MVFKIGSIGGEMLGFTLEGSYLISLVSSDRYHLKDLKMKKIMVHSMEYHLVPMKDLNIESLMVYLLGFHWDDKIELY